MTVSSIVKPYLCLALLSLGLHAQVAVTPVVQPHVTFVNGAGLPCAACSLYTYVAGTTTPQATYTDATGTSQNTNPIVLDASGGANIWMGANSYKLVLKDVLGTTLWTVDQINSARLFPCGSANAVQIANNTVNGLACDSSITINTTTHTINIGTLPANYVTIGALGTPTTWTFDTTSPATALASLGGAAVVNGLANQLGYYAANGNTISGTNAIPNGTTATTQAGSDNSTKIATTAYVSNPGAISPSSIALASGGAMTGNQGNGTKLQHSSGAITANDCTKFDTNGNTVDAGVSCAAVVARTCNANGCYRIEGDGTIMEWGTISVPATGNAFNSATITFPAAFTTVPVVTANAIGLPSATQDTTTPISLQFTSTTTTGAFAYMAKVIVASAGGGAFQQTITLNWYAIGY